MLGVHDGHHRDLRRAILHERQRAHAGLPGPSVDGCSVMTSHARSVRISRCAPASARRTSPSVISPVSVPSGDTTHAAPRGRCDIAMTTCSSVLRRDPGDLIAPCIASPTRTNFTSKLTAGGRREKCSAEAAGLHQGDRQGMSDGHRHGRTGSRCDPRDRPRAGRWHRAPRPSRAPTAEGFPRIPRNADGTREGPGPDRAARLSNRFWRSSAPSRPAGRLQVAVSGFGGMQKDRGGAGALERRGDLASHVTGFAEPGDDQLAGMARISSTAAIKLRSRRKDAARIAWASVSMTLRAAASHSARSSIYWR